MCEKSQPASPVLAIGGYVFGCPGVDRGQQWIVIMDLAWVVWPVVRAAVGLVSLYSPTETGHWGRVWGLTSCVGWQLCVIWGAWLVAADLIFMWKLAVGFGELYALSPL